MEQGHATILLTKSTICPDSICLDFVINRHSVVDFPERVFKQGNIPIQESEVDADASNVQYVRPAHESRSNGAVENGKGATRHLATLVQLGFIQRVAEE